MEQRLQDALALLRAQVQGQQPVQPVVPVQQAGEYDGGF